MNTIMGVCPECGERLVLRGSGLCRMCLQNLRRCAACGSWFNKKRMTRDKDLLKKRNKGTKYCGWVCLGCVTSRQKANV